MTAAAAVESPWVWEARPDVWLLIAGLAVAYWWSVTRLRLRLPEPPPMPTRNVQVRFAAGLTVLWFAVDWPMDRLGDDYLFSVHVAQFLLITMVAAPLLVLGVPVWLQAIALGPAVGIVRRLSRGPIALGLFQLVLVGTHFPIVVASYTSNSVVHFSLHALWVVTACVFWLPIVGAEPVAVRLRPPLQVMYLIAATVVPTVPAGFLTWTETALYPSYTTAPRVWGLSPVQDMQLAGAIMKLGGGFILWAVILWVFATWATKESRTSRPSLSPTSTSTHPELVADLSSVTENNERQDG